MDLGFTGVKDMVSNTAKLPIKSLGEDHATTLEQHPRITSQDRDIFQGIGGPTPFGCISAVLIVSNQQLKSAEGLKSEAEQCKLALSYFEIKTPDFIQHYG